jgi:hypothetical protein
MPENTEQIRQGKAAWARLKQDSRSWNDWVLVGYALLEGRAIAIGNAGVGQGYGPAYNSCLVDNRFNLRPSDRSALLALMGVLPAVEAWRATLAETRRLRMNHPATVMRLYRVAIGIKSSPDHIAPPPSPAPL